MAFPTAAQLTFVAVDLIGANIMNTGTTKQFALGTICKGVDTGSLGYGQAQFIYLKGVASTAAGDLVVYDPVAGTTTRSVIASRGQVAVAMSANVASQYGWYMVQGQAPVSTTAAGTGAANASLELTATPGQCTVGGSNHAYYVLNAVCKAAQDTPSSGFTQVSLSYPFMNGFTATALATA
jgi:hypothetical protein